MWRTDTYWFDVALATSILTIGNICFGRFVEYQSRGLRILKALLSVALVVGTTAWAGRAWTYALLGVLAVAALVVHGIMLPRRGVNGWTAEPRERYYELRGLGPDGKKRPTS
jgi:hypothetical protein